MRSLEKICDILNLQRNNLEREIASLDSQIQSIDSQLAAIELQKQKMTLELYSSDILRVSVQDLRWLETWKDKLVYTIQKLEQLKSDLIIAREPKRQSLSQIIVKENLISAQRRAQLKQEANLREENQTSERMETWINSHIL